MTDEEFKKDVESRLDRIENDLMSGKVTASLSSHTLGLQHRLAEAETKLEALYELLLGLSPDADNYRQTFEQKCTEIRNRQEQSENSRKNFFDR